MLQDLREKDLTEEGKELSQTKTLPVPSSRLLSEDRCAICLEAVKLKGKPAECSHLYCLECITAWTRFSNVCPLCKHEISSIVQFDEEGSEVARVPVQKPLVQYEEALMEELVMAELCYICQAGENDEATLLCDRCNFEVAHLECLGLASVPVEDWICFKCKEELRAEQQARLREQQKKKRREKQRAKEAKKEQSAQLKTSIQSQVTTCSSKESRGALLTQGSANVERTHLLGASSEGFQSDYQFDSAYSFQEQEGKSICEALLQNKNLYNQSSSSDCDV